MTTENLLPEVRKYFEEHPNLNKIIKQLAIDEESYFKAINCMKSNIIIPKRTLSNKTHDI